MKTQIARERNLTLNKYADPTEGAREGLTVAEAEEIASIDWRDLIVTDEDGRSATLGEVVALKDAALECIEISETGGIDQWPGRFVSAPGETPDWDTPRDVDVDWRGFRAAVEAALEQ